MIELKVTGDSFEAIKKELQSLFKEAVIIKDSVPKREDVKPTIVQVRTEETKPIVTPAQQFVNQLNNEDKKEKVPSLDICKNIYVEAVEKGIDKAKIKAILNALEVAKITAIPENKRKYFVDEVKRLINA